MSRFLIIPQAQASCFWNEDGKIICGNFPAVPVTPSQKHFEEILFNLWIIESLKCVCTYVHVVCVCV